MELKKINIKKDFILDKGLLNNLWVPIMMFLSLLYFLSEEKSDFIVLIKLICAILSVVIGVIVYSKIPNIKNDFLKYLGIGFLYVGIINFGEILLINQNTSDITKITIRIFAAYFEFTIIICSLILYKKRLGFLTSKIIFTINLVVSLILSKYTISKLILNKTIEHATVEYIYIAYVVIILITIITIYLVLTNFDIDYTMDKLWLIRITLLFSIYNIIECLGVCRPFDFTYIENMFRLISYGVAYRYVEKKLLNNSYREISNKLIGIQRIRKTMNNNLMKKERELRESRMNIKKSQQRYEEIIESISDGILIFQNNKLIYINKNCKKYVYCKLIEEIKEIDLKNIIKLITGVEVQDNKINDGFVEEFIIENIEKHRANISLTLKNISYKEKVLLIRDITQINELEKFNQEINKARSMETIKDEFYSNISHELRTPINVINSALQLNNLLLKENKLDIMSKNNIIIRQNCLRLIRTINNFIDTNRISEGFLEPVKKVYNIVSIVEEVVLSCNKYMLLRSTELVFDTELENMYIECDRDHIERIMLNILSNSLKYGKLHGEIDVEIKRINSEVSILVRNDAPPIPDEKKVIIFEKFTKLDNSLARQSEGSGLGLYLSKELVELNGGYIEMYSDIEIGNLFDIRFPFKLLKEPLEIDIENHEYHLREKVDIEFSDIYFD